MAAFEINNLTADSRIKPGEKVLTSGGDQIFPRGLPVGTIESIAPDPDHQPYTAITIRPAVNLSRVEEVLVITGTQSDLPAGAQQDLTPPPLAARSGHQRRTPPWHSDDPPALPQAAAHPARPDSKYARRKAAAPLPSPNPFRPFTPTASPTGTTPPAAEHDPRSPSPHNRPHTTAPPNPAHPNSPSSPATSHLDRSDPSGEPPHFALADLGTALAALAAVRPQRASAPRPNRVACSNPKAL